jgi:hypothetical protein
MIKIKWKIRGNSLYLVIFISFVLAILLLYSMFSTLIDITNASIETRLADPKDTSQTILKSIQSDKMSINTKSDIERWGGYFIVNASSSWRNFSYHKTGIAGTYLFSGEKTGLYLADHSIYLSISGNTHITGTTWLPGLGIRSTYIEGKSYKGSKLVEGKEMVSGKKLPLPDATMLAWIQDAMNRNYAFADSSGNMGSLYTLSSIYQPYCDKALLFETSDLLFLNNIILDGKIFIRSDSAIVVGSKCHTSGTILMAPKIIINEGFSGDLQAFATDSILIEKNVTIKYPGFIVVYGLSHPTPFCHLSEGTTVEGAVVCLPQKPGAESAKIVIDAKTVVDGLVYCDGSVSHKGRIYGSLYTGSFFMQTISGYYENHLLDAVIDPLEQSDDFLIPDIFGTKAGLSIIEWIE